MQINLFEGFYPVLFTHPGMKALTEWAFTVSLRLLSCSSTVWELRGFLASVLGTVLLLSPLHKENVCAFEQDRIDSALGLFSTDESLSSQVG